MDNVRPPTIVQNRVPRRVSFENLDSAGIGGALRLPYEAFFSALHIPVPCILQIRPSPELALCVLDRHKYGSC